MNRLSAASATVVLFVSLSASVAAAKGISQAAICGGAGCKDVTNTTTDVNVAFPMGKVVDPPRTSAPFVRVVVLIGEPAGMGDGTNEIVARSSFLYVPSLHLVRTQRQRDGGSGPQLRATWQKADALLVQGMGNLLYGFKRFPATRLDLIEHSPKVTLPPMPKSEEAASREPDMVIHYLPKKQAAVRTDGGSSIAWWIGGAAAALIAAGLAIRLRQRFLAANVPPKGLGA